MQEWNHSTGDLPAARSDQQLLVLAVGLELDLQALLERGLLGAVPLALLHRKILVVAQALQVVDFALACLAVLRQGHGLAAGLRAGVELVDEQRVSRLGVLGGRLAVVALAGRLVGSVRGRVGDGGARLLRRVLAYVDLGLVRISI